MKPIYYCLFLCLAFTGKSFSQENLNTEVTVRYTNGTEKSGKMYTETYNFNSLDFYPAEANNSEKLTATTILSVTDSKGNEIFKSYSADNQKYLTKLLVGGEIDLYYYVDSSSSERFMAQSEEFGDKDLLQTSFSKSIDSKSYQTVTKQYIGTMKVMFGNCQPKNVDNTKYSVSSLSKAFEDYNTCKNNLTYSSPLQNKKAELRLGILTGANFTTVKTPLNTLVEDFDSKTGIAVGTELTYIPSIAASKITGTLGVFYTEKGSSAKSLRQNFSTLEVDYKAVEINFDIRYSILNADSKLNPFLGIGLSKGFIINDMFDAVVKVTEDGERSSYFEETPYNYSQSYKLSIHYEGGVNYFLNNTSGLIAKAFYFDNRENSEFFQAQGISLQVGYFFRF